MKDGWVSLLLVGLVILVCQLLVPEFYFAGDVQAAHIPVCSEIARLWRAGEFPWLTDCSWGCRALAAEYQYGIFNPIQQVVIVAISALSDLGWASALQAGFFSWLGVWGCVRLARSYGLSLPLALSFGMVFCFSRYSLCMCWRVGVSYAISSVWLPWFWEACRKPRLSPWWYCLLLYLILSSGGPFTVLATGTLIGYHMLLAAGEKNWRKAGALFVLSLAATAVGQLPISLLAEYAQGGYRDKGVSWVLVLDPVSLLTYFLPGTTYFSTCFNEVSMNMSIAWIPSLGLLGLASRRFRGLPHRSLLGLALLWFLMAIAPSLGGFRMSSRWLLFFNPLMTLIGLLWLQQASREGKPFGRGTWLALLLAQLVGPGLSLARGLPLVSLWQPGLFLLLWCLAWNRLPAERRDAWIFLGVLAGLFLVTPPRFIHEDQYPYRFAWQNRLVEPDRQYFSLYVEKDIKDPDPNVSIASRLGNLPLLDNRRFVNGYSPIFSSPLTWALHLSAVGYSYADENGVVVIGEAVKTGNLFDKLDVTGLLISPLWRPLGPHLQQNGWVLQGTEGQVQVWHRNQHAPLLPAESLTSVQKASSLAQVVQETYSGNPLNVLLTTQGESGPARYASIGCRVLSQTRLGIRLELGQTPPGQKALVAVRIPWVRGFRAFFRGQELPIQTLNVQHMGVELPAGSPAGELRVVYQPKALDFALPLAGLGLLGCLVLGLPRFRRLYQPSPEAESGAEQ